MSIQLYNPKEVKEVREKLWKEQNGKDLLTGLPVEFKDSVLDHCHDSQYVRGVLHRQSNATLGKIENLWIRFLRWWYPEDLATFLRKVADYLDKDHPREYLHPKALKKLQTEFNKLSEGSKNQVLVKLGSTEAKNSTERKKAFAKLILNRDNKFEDVMELIKENL